jgi:hypothetical protein
MKDKGMCHMFMTTGNEMNRIRTTLLLLAFAAASVLIEAQTQPDPQAAQAQTQSPGPPSTAASSVPPDGGWHLQLAPYLWFPGTHGTVGALGRDASARASAWDLLSHFNFGIMGAADARHNRFLLNGDLMWIRLSDSSALPFPSLSATSADVRVGQLVWTSKLGYRLIDHKRFKADANVGARFWHLGQTLNFNPSLLGLNFASSQNWADVVVGGRLELPMGSKVSLITFGDVGGWNATSKLDYQFGGLVGYSFSPKWTLLGGYRYLFVDYRRGAGVYNMVTSGALVGLSYRFK